MRPLGGLLALISYAAKWGNILPFSEHGKEVPVYLDLTAVLPHLCSGL